jgi:hypothetical protein
MTIMYVISIKNVISQRLLSNKEALHFFQRELSIVVVDNVVIDFSDIKSMSYSFAHQYVTCKNQSKRKKIREINVPDYINIILELAKQDIDQSNQQIMNKKKTPVRTSSLVIRN